MKPFLSRITWLTGVILALANASGLVRPLQAAEPDVVNARPRIALLDPPKDDFFSKQLDYHGIPIQAHQEVVDEALYEAWNRLDMLLTNQPMVLSNLVAAGAGLQIIGRNQVTSDLPEFHHLKGKPLPEYNGLTIDQRTRGMGGLVSSCGEENLLRLPTDRYRGRDICIHEFAHGIFDRGISSEVRRKFTDQCARSKEQGRWVGSYASNPNEFFSELTMWYWGTRGDLNMQGPKPENGPEGLKKYDPEAYALMDDFYSGRIPIPKLERHTRQRPSTVDKPDLATNSPSSVPKSP